VALPATVDLEWYRGDSSSQTFRFLSAGAPISLTGATVACWAQHSDRTVEQLVVVADGNGEVTISPPAGGIPPGGYAYDVEVTDQAGVVTTWVRGRLSVERDVTNMQEPTPAPVAP
jgi:hypothetical protein